MMLRSSHRRELGGGIEAPDFQAPGPLQKNRLPESMLGCQSLQMPGDNQVLEGHAS